jgi:hypothetical protein
VLVERCDQSIDQLAEQACSLESGDLILLKRMLDVLLDAREMSAEGAEYIVPRHGCTGFSQGREGSGQRGD